MKIEFPQALLERVQAGNVVVCTGVRMAGAAGMPTWEQFLDQLIDKVEGADHLRELVAQGKLLTVAGYLRRKLGGQAIAAALKAAYGKKKDPSATHRWLHKVPFFAALSTGYDTLLEYALEDKEEPKVYTYEDGARLRIGEDLKHYVVKVHGDIENPEKLVFSAGDFKRLVGPNQPYRAFLEDLFRTRTLLLVGYHSYDPDFVLFMDRLMSTFRDATDDHYAILPDISDVEADELYANYRVRALSYESGSDPNDALDEALKTFKEQFIASGGTEEGDEDPLFWLQAQLSAVSVRIDVVAGKGLSLTNARLTKINEAAEQLELQKLDAKSLCRLGNVRLYLGKAQSGIECYRVALEKSPDMARAHLNLHHALAEVGEYEAAHEHLQQAETLDESLRVVPKRYQLDHIIGRGSTGTVYQGKDTQGDLGAVTIKVLRASYVKEHVSPELWLEETSDLRSLTHPNIAAVHDGTVVGGVCVQITENMQGRSLWRTVKEDGPLPPERTIEILLQVCKALEYAHAQNVLHLDVMPSNIFLCQDGSVKLMDFRAGRAQSGRVITTPKGAEGFRAPELIAAVGADARADVFGLGATLYYVATGQQPVGSFARIADANPAARRFDRLVTRSMQATVDERPESVAAFAKALAGTAEAGALPDSDDDLVGWLEVLAHQPDHERAVKVLDKLEKGFREKKAWDELVTLLLGRHEVVTDRERRADLLREVARIFEVEQSDAARAFITLQSALRDAPESLEVQQDLERLAGATGMWSELVQEYSTAAQNQREPRAAGDWWVRIGRLYADKLHHADYAIAAFNHALSLDAKRTDALSEMADVVRGKEDYKEYAKLLVRWARIEKGTDREAEVLLRLADTYATKLSSNEEAILTYRRVLEVNSTEPTAISALAALYKKAEMWDELVELMRSRIPLVESSDEKTRYRHILADVLAEQLDAKDEAIDVLREVVEKNSDDIKALKGLERLYGATGRNEEYLRILNKRIEAAKDDGEKIALYRRLADEWQEQSGGLKRAAEYLVEIHKLGGATEGTYRNLVRIYWELKDHKALVETYGWHIAVAERPEDRAVLHAALGRLYEEHVEDVPAAIRTFAKVLEDEPKNSRALEALARLHEKNGAWDKAADQLARLVGVSDDKAKPYVYRKLGEIQLERLADLDEAEKCLVKARELAEACAKAAQTAEAAEACGVRETLLVLGKLYLVREDFGKAARLYQTVAAETQNELDKVGHLFDAGQLYREKLNDRDKALDAYLAVLEINPEHLEAAEQAAEILIARGAHVAALSPLETLVRKTAPDNKPLLLERNLKLGQAALAAEDNVRAEVAFRAAHDLDPANHLALVNLANLLLEKKAHDEAGKLLQALLVHRRDTLPKEEVVDIFFKLSDVKLAQGDEAKAHNMIEKALDVDPHNPKVLAHAIEIYTERKDWESVLKCQRNMLKALPDQDKDGRAKLLEEIGDLQFKHLNRSTDAIKSYKESLDQVAKVRRVLHKKMEVHAALSQWDDALALIATMVDIEQDAAHRYRLHNTAGLILRDELKRYHEAAEQFDKALADLPSNPTAFNLLKELYLDQKEYKKLARAYRTVLARMPEDTPVERRIELWRELAEMAQTKIKDAREAIIALEMVSKLDPEATDYQESLARLYTSAGEDAYDKAIDANQALLDLRPMHREAYHELFRIYRQQGETDKTFNVASVLALLKAANGEQKAFYDKHRPNGELRRARVSLRDDEVWRAHLHHRDQVPVISEVLSIVSSLFVPMAIKDRDEHKLRAADQLQPLEASRPWGQVFQYVCGVLEVSPNEVYERAGKASMSLLLVSEEEESHSHVLLVNPTVLESADERELVFHFGRSLSLMRDEHMVLYVSPTPTVIQALLLACLRLTDPVYAIKGDVEVIDRLANAFHSELPASQVDAIAKRYNELIAAARTEMVEQWMRSAELTIDRAGLLLCDDLETAARLASTSEPLSIEEGLTTKERVAQLFRYAASEDFFALRDRVGLKIR